MQIFESEYSNFQYQVFKRKRQIETHYRVHLRVNKLNREVDPGLFTRVNKEP